MRTIQASEFKAKCRKLMDQVAVPVAERPRSLWGAHKGLIEIKGDIISPIDVEWEADR